MATVLALVITLVGALALGGSTTATGATTHTSSRGTVAHDANGTMKSTIAGTASNGGKVTGTFTPLRFKKTDGKQWVKGVIDGVVTNPNGTKQTFTALRTMKVKSIDGRKLTGLSRSGAQGEAAAACQILNLVLGPLDLNLLGLTVHLDKVVLNVAAVAGAGNLLGNLLCAVAGLLDGGPLAGLLSQLNTLLNQILGALNLGI